METVQVLSALFALIIAGKTNLQQPQVPETTAEVQCQVILDGGGSAQGIFKDPRHTQVPWPCWNAPARAGGIVSVIPGKWWELGEVSENWEKANVLQKARRRVQGTPLIILIPGKIIMKKE